MFRAVVVDTSCLVCFDPLIYDGFPPVSEKQLHSAGRLHGHEARAVVPRKPIVFEHEFHLLISHERRLGYQLRQRRELSRARLEEASTNDSHCPSHLRLSSKFKHVRNQYHVLYFPQLQRTGPGASAGYIYLYICHFILAQGNIMEDPPQPPTLVSHLC